MHRAWGAYQAWLRRRPYLANSVTSGVVMLVGDTMSQRTQHPGRHDWNRTAVMVSWSSGFFTPFFVTWFRTLEAHFPTPTLPTCVLKAALTALSGPLVNGAFFVYSTTAEHVIGSRDVVERGTKQEINRKLRDELPAVVVNSARVWGPFNTLNWWLCPAHLRIGVASVVSTGWNWYISSVQHGAGHGHRTGSVLLRVDSGGEHGEEVDGAGTMA